MILTDSTGTKYSQLNPPQKKFISEAELLVKKKRKYARKCHHKFKCGWFFLAKHFCTDWTPAPQDVQESMLVGAFAKSEFYKFCTEPRENWTLYVRPSNFKVQIDLFCLASPVSHMVSKKKILVNETQERGDLIWPLPQALQKYSETPTSAQCAHRGSYSGT